MTDRRWFWVVLGLIAASAGAGPSSPESKPWAFRPVARPEVPRRDGPASANPIDAFLDRAIESEGLNPAPRRTDGP